MTTTTVDLLRHGEPVRGRRIRGALDDPLSEQGWSQMRATVADHCPWDTIVSSPLTRCAAFAREVAERHQLPLAIEPGLREIGFGAWEGLTAEDIDPEMLGRFWRDPVNCIPSGGEPLVVFADRVIAAWSALLERHTDRHLLVVAHGGTIRVILSHILNMPLASIWRLDVPYAALSRVRLYRREAKTTPLLIFHAGSLG